MNQQGILFLFSGPSGVGKKTLLDVLFEKKELNLVPSISMTTREKRPYEVHGVDYFFVTKDYFMQQVQQNNMLEYAEFFDTYYGTPKSYVFQMLAQGKNVVLEIEVIGAQQVMDLMPDCVSIFILPPSLEELKNRLIKRNTETMAKIQKRLEKATVEIDLQSIYQYRVYNDNKQECIDAIEQIIRANIRKHKESFHH